MEVEDSSGYSRYKFLLQSLFPSLSTTGTGGESLFISVTNSNQLNFKGLKSSDITKMTVATTTNNLVLSLVEGEYAFNSDTPPVAIPRANYNLAIGANPPGFATVNPPVSRYHAGFSLKENRYVANLINNSNASNGEILFGEEMSGVKGFYVTGVLATDLTTDPGGEKQLFSVMSDYIMNNGY